MCDNGRIMLILGANKIAEELSRDGQVFFNWLYSHYNVTSQFEVDGSPYARQGAAWPVRVVSINGRVESDKVAPVEGTIERVGTWEKGHRPEVLRILGAVQS